MKKKNFLWIQSLFILGLLLFLSNNCRKDNEPIVYSSIATGGLNSFAMKTDGSLWAWGYNKYGQLGDGTTEDNHSPVRIGF